MNLAVFFTTIRNKILKSSPLDSEFKTFGTQQIFNKIYRQKRWGQSAHGGTSGRGSHDPMLVAPYVSVIKEVLSRFSTRPSMVDLGCGDFNVGRHFKGEVSSLTACDVSDIIIAQNIRLNVDENIQFLQLDLAKDPIPKADIFCVRQVLQHVANSEISAFVSALHEQKPCRALIVTEHLSTDPLFIANKDKYTGVTTRASLMSGVDLAHPPFSLEYTQKEVLLELTEPCDGQPGLLRTTLYTFDNAFPTLTKKGE